MLLVVSQIYVRVYLCISLVSVLGTLAYFRSFAREKIFLSELTFNLKVYKRDNFIGSDSGLHIFLW
jgi:hypothetical protein